MAQDVLVDKDLDHRVAVITLNRPERRNALSGSMIEELNAAYDDVLDVDEIGCVVLTGADPAFCAGMDLKEMGREGGTNVRMDFHTRLWETSTPVIGAINGPTATGGLELALACDWLVASERASFADTHARVGLLPGAGMSVLLPQAVGLRKAKEMSLTGRFIEAEEAAECGLVNRCVSHRNLLDVALAEAREVAGNHVVVTRRTKRLLEENARRSVGDALENERSTFVEFLRAKDFAEVEASRESVVARGRRQAGSDQGS